MELVGVDRDDGGEATVHEVSVSRRTRTVVFTMVALLAAVVGASVLLDRTGDAEVDAGGSDERGPVDEPAVEDAIDPELPTTEPTEPPSPRPEVPPTAGGASGVVEPVEAWEGYWLITIDDVFGSVVQVPLGGGEIVELVPRAASADSARMAHSPVHARLVGEVMIGSTWGVSLVDGSRWQVDSPPGQWEHVVGVTGTGTVVTAGSQVRERSIDGEVVGNWNPEHPVLASRQFHAVVGRSALADSAHGVIAFDFDDGSFRRVTDGSLLTVSGDLAAVTVCDDELRCEIQLLDVGTGEVVSAFDPPALGPPPFFPGPTYEHRPSLSPDGTRLVVLDQEHRLLMIDTDSGGELGVGLDLRSQVDGTGWRHATVSTVWGPEVERMLVVVVRVDGPGVTVWSVDQDGETVRAPAGLEAALDAVSARGMGFTLSDRAFEPVDQEP